MSPDERILLLEREVSRLRRAIDRHRRETQCCDACSTALILDAKTKRKATADGRLWASANGGRSTGSSSTPPDAPGEVRP